MNSDRIKYWDEFYNEGKVNTPIIPSQFAAFVLGETHEIKRIVEFGCGNGRDAAFFSAHGLAVTALDASLEAIKFCQRRWSKQDIEFVKFSLGEDDIYDTLDSRVSVNDKAIIYARFFLHAISDAEEAEFVALARNLVVPDSIIALEYRCSGDKETKKEFGQHFRRYLSHAEICDRVSDAGFELLYEIEGRGFAKYKSEDAVVGRCIARRK